jgi:hypothetical protein
MSDLHTVEASTSEKTKARIDEYVERCGLTITKVFHKPPHVRREFEQWFATLLSESKNPLLLLHEEPLYLVAEYLGYNVSVIEGSSWSVEYDRLAAKLKWYDDTP